MKVRRAKSSYILIVGVMTLLAAGSFLFYGLYSALTKTQITKEQQAEIRPLNGNLNQKVIDNLSKRRQFSSEILAGVRSFNYSETKAVVVAETIETENIATDSGIVDVATGSGELAL